MKFQSLKSLPASFVSGFEPKGVGSERLKGSVLEKKSARDWPSWSLSSD
jgi:hypothetical protein